MTNAAQAALRRTMEKETRSTRFCLVCNYVSRIIDPITSRCTKFRFVPLGEEKIIERLMHICEQEKVTIEEKAVKAIVDTSAGDLRKAITTLQSCYRLKCGADENRKENKIGLNDILEMSGVVPTKYLEEFVDVCRMRDEYKLENFVEEFMFEAYSIAQFFDQINDYIVNDESITNYQKSLILDKLGECSFRLVNGGSEYLQIMDLAFSMIKAFRKQ
jgi:replication factor C subunit 2/4